MRVFRRRAFGLAIPLFALFSLPARSQNLLSNPGFDRDLSGWTPRILDGTSTQPNANTFVAWDSSDAAGSAASGGAGLRARALEWQGATAAVGQCVPVPSPSLVSFGARFLTRRERLSDVTTTAAFFASRDCTGTSMSSARAPAMPSSITTGSNSGGLWVSNGTQALSPPGAHSIFLEVGAKAEWTWFYGSGWLDVVADDAFLTLTPTATTFSILPSAAWISGNGAYWSTRMTLVNPGAADAAVTLKWLGHDMDGRGGAERAYLVRAGQTLDLAEEEWEISHQQNYGAILVTSSSPSLLLQSQTSTSSPGGTVGQALPALGAADFASATPKALAPIRENAAFRTNLVLANPTEIPVTAHVGLYAADGTPIGSRDVDLPPLGMTQINRVASALGATNLDAGRISVSTATPGGLVATYASVIDNVTNDPRTLLPQDGTVAAPSAPPTTSPNLLVNPGFARDLSEWHVQVTGDGRPLEASVGWTALDASGSPTSGGLALHAYTLSGTSISLGYGQCAPVPARSLVSFGARFLTTRAFSTANGRVRLTFFDTPNCWGVDSGTQSAFLPDSSSIPPVETNSGGRWVTAAASAQAPAYARSALIDVGISSVGTQFLGSSYIDAVGDDAYLTTAIATRYVSILPSAAWASGLGPYWRTEMVLVNPSTSDATVTLKWLGHDLDGWMGVERSYRAPAGETLRLSESEWEHDHAQSYGAILVTSSTPTVFLQSETSTSLPGGGTVGQALPALGPSDFATATPKALAPIRENAAFRTNLVLANPTEIPVTAHVGLYAANGTPIGSRDVDLPALGMTQINRVASALGATNLDAGRISVSTATPGGLVAAYASVIDNVTNDPRTLLPR